MAGGVTTMLVCTLILFVRMDVITILMFSVINAFFNNFLLSPGNGIYYSVVQKTCPTNTESAEFSTVKSFFPVSYTHLLDTVMLGQLGEVAMSGSSLGNQIGFIYQIMNLGLTAGAGVLTSQYWGRKDSVSIRKVMSMAYKISMTLAAIFTILALTIPDILMSFYTKEPEVIEAGAQYLRIIAFTYLVSGFTMTSMSILRTVGTVKITLYMYIISFFVNVFFNYCLIFGHFGFPQMGIVGAAIATLIARVVELSLIHISSTIKIFNIFFSLFTGNDNFNNLILCILS